MSAAALRRVGTAALHWIESHRIHFRVSPAADDLSLVRKVKPIAELGLACDLLLRAGCGSSFGAKFRTLPQELLASCWSELDKGEHLRRLLLTYPDLFSLVTVYPPFRRAGFRNHALEGAIKSLSADPSLRALEFPAWRLLDFAVALRAICVRSPWQPRQEFGRTWLGQTPAPWMLSDSAAYSLTHTVFYMTDFGFNPGGLPSRARAYVSRWVPVWSRYYASVQNLDLLGEMLMVGYCLGVNTLAEPLRKLVDGQREDGAIPGPEAIAVGLGMDRGRRSARERFALDYHTTVVALMTSVLGLRLASGRPKPPRQGRKSAVRPRHENGGASRGSRS